MDARPKTRQVNRQRKTPPPQPPRGAKQIVIPMTREQYDDLWHDAERVRAFLAEWARSAPELFPADFDRGYRLHGFGRESRKLPGLKLRKIVLADGTSYWLRPSFITSYMTGTVEELAYPLLLAAHGVPPWLLTIGFARRFATYKRATLLLRERARLARLLNDPARPVVQGLQGPLDLGLHRGAVGLHLPAHVPGAVVLEHQLHRRHAAHPSTRSGLTSRRSR